MLGSRVGSACSAMAVKKIKVGLMLTPVEFGGAERVCLTLLQNIDRQRFDVNPILLTRPWEFPNFFVCKLREENLDFVELPVARRDQGDYLRVARCLGLVYKAMKHQRPDVLHTHGYFADIVGLAAAKFLGVPVIVTCHGFITNTWKYRLYNMVDRWFLRAAGRVIAVSPGIRDELTRHGISSDRIRLIENAVGTTQECVLNETSKRERRLEIGANSGDLVLGYVGRLSDEKGVRNLLLASERLIRGGLNIRVCIVGDGPQREELVALSAQIGIGENVRFLGFQENVHSWLECMDIFVLPSLTEGTPMALLEAMAARVPVIASAVGGVPRLVEDDVTGILVPPADPEKIAHAVRHLVSNPANTENLVANAHQRVIASYSITQWIRAIEDEYAALSGR